jgi:hypothetical protein
MSQQRRQGSGSQANKKKTTKPVTTHCDNMIWNGSSLRFPSEMSLISHSRFWKNSQSIGSGTFSGCAHTRNVVSSSASAHGQKLCGVQGVTSCSASAAVQTRSIAS